jgi:CheY-like chemotaxis protein
MPDSRGEEAVVQLVAYAFTLGTGGSEHPPVFHLERVGQLESLDRHGDGRSERRGEGLRSSFEAVAEVTVVGEAVNGRELLAVVNRHRPDVVLTDIRMPDVDGIAATRLLLAHHPPASEYYSSPNTPTTRGWRAC